MSNQDNRSSGRRRGPRRRRPQDENRHSEHKNKSGYQSQHNGSQSGGYRPSSRTQADGRPSERHAEPPKPSLLQRILSFFGFGPKKKSYPAYEGGKSQHPSRRESSPAAGSKHSTSGSGTASASGATGAATPAAGAAPSRPARKPEAVQVTSPKLYVGNLSFDATESDVSELFNGVGTVRNVEIVTYKDTYKSKGFGFVTMAATDEAVRAVTELHDKDFMGRRLVVSGAKTNDRPQEKAQEEKSAAQPTESALQSH